MDLNGNYKHGSDSRIDWYDLEEDCWEGKEVPLINSDTIKKTHPVAAENGSQLEYTVIVRNKTSTEDGVEVPLYIRVKDQLPTVFKNQNVTIAYKREKKHEENRTNSLD